ncbi:MAG TPA: DUF6781 family protein [Phycisphaerales bacterium]|nr:DUF6781 family protein [Phycisphaerales bacterium]
MARKTSSRPAKKRAADGAVLRDRVHDLSVRALRGGDVSGREVTKLVRDVFDGAVEGLDAAVPASNENVLRQVFDGLRQGVHAAAAAGETTADEMRRRGRTLSNTANKRLREADKDFLEAVEDFADKAVKEVRDELNSLVSRARRTGPKVVDSMREAADAADGRMTELAGETSRAGARAARKGAGALVMGAEGLLSAIADVLGERGVAPVKRPSRRTTARPAPKSAAGKKTSKKRSKR